MCYVGSCGRVCHTGRIQIVANDHMSTASSDSVPLGRCRDCGTIGRFVSSPRCGEEKPLGAF